MLGIGVLYLCIQRVFTVGLSAYGQINLAKMAASMPELTEGIEGWINMNYNFLGMDLTINPWDAVKNFASTPAAIGLILIPVLAGGSQLLFSMMTMKQQKSDANNASMKSMMYIRTPVHRLRVW